MTTTGSPEGAPRDAGRSTASLPFLLRAERPDELAAYLRACGWLPPDEPQLAVAPAGEGNMNCTLRLTTARRTLVVKQGRVRGVPGIADLTDLHAKARLHDSLLVELLDYLRVLHARPVDERARGAFRNDAMRRLNHEYIFRLPLANEAALHARLAQALAHGDFFPGSWLSDGIRVKVIDPEFCFTGAPKFDYGVMAAHLLLGEQDAAVAGRVLAAAEAAGFDADLVAGFAGVASTGHAAPLPSLG